MVVLLKIACTSTADRLPQALDDVHCLLRIVQHTCLADPNAYRPAWNSSLCRQRILPDILTGMPAATVCATVCLPDPDQVCEERALVSTLLTVLTAKEE